MNIKSFLKTVSIYGMLPVLTKFANFLLIPVYVRIFSSYEFGIIELIISSMQFVIFAINLELYSGVGRYFFEKETFFKKRELVSTGFWMTIIMSSIILLLGIVFNSIIHDYLFADKDYHFELKLGIIWAVITAISTYLSILPRYEGKAKKYVISNFASLLMKLGFTIFFVIVLKLGISGILFGYIIGSITSGIFYYLMSKKYITFAFSKTDMYEIANFAIPIVPGLLVGAFLKPMIRTIIAQLFSMEELGLYAFALRIATVLTLVESGIRLSWRPMLYENIKNANFGKDYLKISTFVGRVLLFTGIGITLFSNELIHIIGTPEYFDATQLVGFILISKILANLSLIRGFGFEVANKTYLISIINSFSAGLTIILFYTLARKFGFVGIVIVPLIPGVISYIIKITYTKKFIQGNVHSIIEYALWIMMIFVSILNIFNVNILFRLLIFAILIILGFLYSYFHKNGLINIKKTSNIT